MVRAPAHSPALKALPRSSGFALLKPAEKPQLDPARILTMSGTIAVNLLALGMLMLPLSMPPPVSSIDAEPRDVIRWIPHKQPPPEKVEFVEKTKPAPVEAKPVETRTTTPKPLETASSEIVTDAGTEYVPTSGETTGPTESIDIVETGPAAMQLEYRLAPAPVYPRRALQQRLTGTVLLQVLVGLDGRPLEVSIARSSGHRELDEAARAQVLKRWSFQPAMKNGLAVQAIGMVPIEFALKN